MNAVLNKQRQLPLTDQRESQAERCQRILAGVPGIRKASEPLRTFDEHSAAEAAARLGHQMATPSRVLFRPPPGSVATPRSQHIFSHTILTIGGNSNPTCHAYHV
jgi:hypothetical protein